MCCPWKLADGRACGVRTNKTEFAAGMVVNCAGAWAGQIGPHSFPTRPVKGQMLCVIMPEKEMVRHVVRAPDVYLIPRSDGRMLIGATAEEAGFDKQTVPETILKLRQAAIELVPQISRGAHSRVMGRSASRNTRRAADPGRNGDARIFCRDWTFSGWNFAGSGDGEGDGTDHDRAELSD